MNLNGGGCFRPSTIAKTSCSKKLEKENLVLFTIQKQSRTGGGAALRFLYTFGFFILPLIFPTGSDYMNI